MFELTTGTDTLSLQSIAGVGELHRRRCYRRRSYYSNTCLVTGNGSLNGINVLNILNGFGGGW